MAIVFGLLAAVTYGTADFLGGLATKRNPVIRVVLISQGTGLIAYLAVVPFLPEGRFTREAWVWGAAAGGAGAIGIAFLYRGLARGRMSVVAPITAVVAVSIPVLVGRALGERPTGVQLVGIAAVVPAVGLISAVQDAPSRLGADPRQPRAGVLDAAVSGLGIGLFLVALSRGRRGDGSVAARLGQDRVPGPVRAGPDRDRPRPPAGPGDWATPWSGLESST